MKHKDLLRKFGIKLTFIAEEMGVSEQLLRYHLDKPKVDEKVEKLFLKALGKLAKDLEKQVEKLAA